MENWELNGVKKAVMEQRISDREGDESEDSDVETAGEDVRRVDFVQGSEEVDMDKMKTIFSDISPDTVHNSSFYERLGNEHFNYAERFWLCKEVEKTDNVFQFSGSMKQFCDRYHINYNQFTKWRHRFKYDKPYNKKRGRNKAIDAIGDWFSCLTI